MEDKVAAEMEVRVREGSNQDLGHTMPLGQNMVHCGTKGRGKVGEGIREMKQHPQKGKDPGPHKVNPECVLHHQG